MCACVLFFSFCTISCVLIKKRNKSLFKTTNEKLKSRMKFKEQLFLFTLLHTSRFGLSQLSPWYNFYQKNEDKMMITNGILPTLTCPYGHFRNFDKGILLDGCIKCPKGYFGNTTNLQFPNCIAPCPPGTQEGSRAKTYYY